MESRQKVAMLGSGLVESGEKSAMLDWGEGVTSWVMPK